MEFRAKAQTLIIFITLAATSYSIYTHRQKLPESDLGITGADINLSHKSLTMVDDVGGNSYACHRTVHTPIITSYDIRSLDDLQRAARQGDIRAQWKLGQIYSKDDKNIIQNESDIPQDYKEAVKWYRMVAERGSACGQGRLGEMYFLGQGVLQSYEDAYFWLVLSTRHQVNIKNEYFENLRAQTAKKLTYWQRWDIQDHVALWKPQDMPRDMRYKDKM